MAQVKVTEYARRIRAVGQHEFEVVFPSRPTDKVERYRVAAELTEQFGTGYRPTIVRADGRVAYCGATKFPDPVEATDYAENVLLGYLSGFWY